MFEIGREQWRNQHFNMLFRLYFLIFGAPEIGAKIRNHTALKVLARYRFNSLLDAACGKGYATFHLARHRPDLQVLGIDLDREKIAQDVLIAQRSGLQNLRYEVGDVLALSCSDKVDVILTIDNLEHIDDDEQVLKNFRQCLRPGGLLVIHVPYLHQHFFFKAAAEYVVEDHVRDGYTEDELTTKVISAGFEVLHLQMATTYFEAIANQIGNIFAKRLGIYAMLFPFLVLFSRLPARWGRRSIHNSLVLVAKVKI